MNTVFWEIWEKLVFSLSNDLIIMLNNRLQILCGLIAECMEILLLIRTRHLPSEDHDYQSIFQYSFEIFLNWKQRRMVMCMPIILIKREERWVGCGLVMGSIT